MKSLKYLVLLFGIAVIFGSCKNKDDKSFNIFSINDDIELGKNLEAEIASNPAEYPVMPRNAANAVSYGHLDRIVNEILNSGQVFYKDEFEWNTYLIQDDNVLNAFAAPGGYIYVYTGLIKYLDTEDDFAGVMGHEIAHADRRHSTDQLTKAYGLSVMLQLALGDNPGLLSEVAASLLTLSFSRGAETEADEYSVIYLCETDYAANGAAGFFQKLIDTGAAGGTPEFLSTHPNPDNRVGDINDKASELNCATAPNPSAMWTAFQNSLP